MKDSTENDQFSKILQKWDDIESAPKDFESGVWSRIATQDVPSNSVWTWCIQTMLEIGHRPAYAITVAIVALVLSLIGAHVRAGAYAKWIAQQSELAYLESISPFVRSDSEDPTINLKELR